KSAVERMHKMEEQSVGTGASSGQTTSPATAAKLEATASKPEATASKPAAAVPDGKISIDDFAKVELRVAQVKTAERVKGADKLLRLEVDLGHETRQIVAGIVGAHQPGKPIGGQNVIVRHLSPPKKPGAEASGVLLRATV